MPFLGWDPDEETDPFVQAAVAKIVEESGGAVPVPCDFEEFLRADEQKC